MKKRIFLSLAAVVAIALGVVGFSAFEAHIINVTATIENALSVPLKDIQFGTVFPQEQLDKNFDIAMSASFAAEADADGVEYVIKQKPKCIYADALDANGLMKTDYVLPTGVELYGRVTEAAGSAEFVCGNGYVIMPFLCPYLSKHDADPEDKNDYELDAFHGPITAWTDADSTQWAVDGKLAKSENDTSDLWTIDLKVPCFAGQCDQGWAKYVTDINPLADPSAYVQPVANEHKVFGCDLWIEVNGINRLGEYDSSLTLENKDANYNWMIEQDDFKATLLYNKSGEKFKYKLTGKAMEPNTEYDLIYYADKASGWGGDNPGKFIASFTSGADGSISSQGDVELNIDLPSVPDTNGPTGAKLWVVPAAEYDELAFKLTAWNATHYLYEYNLIKYDDTGVVTNNF